MSTTLDEILRDFAEAGQIEPYFDSVDYDVAQQAQKKWAEDLCKEVIGANERQQWDKQYSMCNKCEFELIDGTKNCICVQRNTLRKEQRTKLLEITKRSE